MSKDKIEVNMNVYDIPILVEALEEANKEIKRLKEEYVMLQNASDEVEEKDKEIERLNNIINKGIEAINVYQNGETLSIGYEDLKRIRGILQGNEFDLRMFEEYLQELEGVDKEIYLKTPENYDYIMTLIENNKKLGKELEIRDRKIHHALGYMENAYPEPDWHYVYEILDERNVKDGITRTCTRK